MDDGGVKENFLSSDRGESPVSLVNKTRGPILEIGGMSAAYPMLGDLTLLNRKIVRTNITSFLDPRFDGATGIPAGGYGKSDIVADGLKMPFANNSLGTVLMSHLPKEVVAGIVKEVERTLEKNGVIVFQSVDGLIVTELRNMGFKEVDLELRWDDDGNDWWSGVFTKEPSTTTDWSKTKFSEATYNLLVDSGVERKVLDVFVKDKHASLDPFLETNWVCTIMEKALGIGLIQPNDLKAVIDHLSTYPLAEIRIGYIDWALLSPESVLKRTLSSTDIFPAAENSELIKTAALVVKGMSEQLPANLALGGFEMRDEVENDPMYEGLDYKQRLIYETAVCVQLTKSGFERILEKFSSF